MANRAKFKIVTGTRDLLPPNTALWNGVERTARDVFGTFGFNEIRPPVLELTDLFARSVGEDTDIVGKEMYTFRDNPGDARLEERLDDLRRSYERLAGDDQESRYLASVQGFITYLREKLEAHEIVSNPVLDASLRDLKESLAACESGEFRPDLKPELRRSILVSDVRVKVEGFSLGEEISLRPEATASVCRAYIEHSMQQLPQPVKLYYMGPMFRRERPQKGRYRQFYQIGAEVLEVVRPDAAKDGAKELAKDAAVDAEVIEMLMTYFERAGLQGAELSINSIGHAADNCRRGYVAKLREALTKVKDQLGADSQRRIETNPLRVLDSKLEREQPIIAALPHIADHLCNECKMHFAELQRQLRLRSVKFRENWRLVRGLDYYMRTTFEVTAPGLGSQDAVCGGGRYDGLVELLGGPPTKGIGFAIGEDRLILSIQETLNEVANTPDETLPSFSTVLQRPDVAVAGTSSGTWDQAVQLATSLRRQGFSVFLPKAGTKMQRVFDAAYKLGISTVILVGDDELKQNEYAVRVLWPLNPSGQRDFRVKTEGVAQFGKLVKLRQDLERALLRLATGSRDQGPNRGLLGLVDLLTRDRLLPREKADEVREVASVLNQAVHGVQTSSDSVRKILLLGNQLVSDLEKLSPMGV